MLHAVTELKCLLKTDRRTTESLVFYLHYRVTCIVLFFCCILVSTQQFVGSKINCLSKPSGEINGELLNTYCWAASTYSVSSSYLKEAGVLLPHPGILATEDESEYEYRNFYQYVHIVLFIQATLFYIPHLIWKSVSKNIKIIGSCDKESTKYFFDRWGHYRAFAMKYLSCEMLAVFNVMIQSYLLDIFFHGKFLGLGLLVDVYYGSETLSDPIRLFPLVTACHFRRYGPSGYIDVFDSLCVLPINALNAKIFLYLWIWFIILLLLSLFNVMHLLVCMAVPFYRVLLLKEKPSHGFSDNYSYIKLAKRGNFGDWFVLSSIKRRMDELEFRNLANTLHCRLLYYHKIETKEATEIIDMKEGTETIDMKEGTETIDMEEGTETLENKEGTEATATEDIK